MNPENKYNALISCYGNTRSGVIEAITTLCLERMGQADYVKVSSGGLPEHIKRIFESAGTHDVGLPEAITKTAREIDLEYAKRISEVRRSQITAERLLASNNTLAVDQYLVKTLRRLIPKPTRAASRMDTILGYVGHSRQPFGVDLDDSSPRGALEIITLTKGKNLVPKETINAKLEAGEFRYHAPFGGDYVIGPAENEAGIVEVKQLILLSRLLAQKLAEDAYKTRSLVNLF